MQKDFITATPDSGGAGGTTVNVTCRAIQECPDYQNMEYVMDAACKESWQNSQK